MASFMYHMGLPSLRLMHVLLRKSGSVFDGEHASARERATRISENLRAMTRGELVIDVWKPICYMKPRDWASCSLAQMIP